MGKHNKRPKSYYIQSAKRQKRRNNVLEPGVKGFLCTCNFHERDCVREAYNLLNKFADQLYGAEKLPAKPQPGDKAKDTEEDVAQQEVEKGDGEEVREEPGSEASKNKEKTAGGDEGGGSDDDDEVDIDAALKADIEELQTKRSGGHEVARRFQQIESGANNCIFIRTTLPDPLPVSLAIMDNILETQEQCTKRLMRMVPVHATCKAFTEDIESTVKDLAGEYFEKGGKSFYITFKARNSNSVKRETLTSALVKVLQEAHPENTPDMITPDVVLNVEVIRNMCCLSFLPHYLTKYAKYNLVTLATKGKEDLKKDKSQNGAVKKDEKNGKEVNGQNKEVKSKDEEVKSQDKEVKSKDEEVKSQDKEVKSKDEEVTSKDEEVKNEDEEVKGMDEEVKIIE